MKAYTDIEQSKKLAEILPLESADMWYQHIGISIKDDSEKPIYFPMVIRDCESDKDIPCWSLTALIDVLPLEIETHKQTDGHKIYYYVESYMKRMGKEKYLSTKQYENLVDACYEMVLTLHDNNLL